MAAQSPYPRLLNSRSYAIDRYEARPGETLIQLISTNQLVHSIRRLNDDVPGAAHAAIYVVGAGTSLYAQYSLAFTPPVLATGFSGNPLSLVPYRPDQSPQAWMYVMDSGNAVKVNSALQAFNMGGAPPAAPPTTNLGVPAFTAIDSGNATTGWAAGGTAGAITAPLKVNTTSVTILADNQGTYPNFALIQPTVYSPAMQRGSLITVGFGGGSAETVPIIDVFPAIASTTIAAISYDTGTSGACSIQATAPNTQPLGLRRNAFVQLGSGGQTEFVRIISVTQGPTGLWSFRCVTLLTHVVSEVIIGLPGFRAYLNNTHINAENLVINTLQSTIATGIGTLTKTIVIDLSVLGNRPIADTDQIHLSVSFDNPANLIEGRVWFDVDTSVGDFAHNAYYYPFRQSDLTPATTQTQTQLTTLNTGIQNQQVDRQSNPSSPLNTLPDYVRQQFLQSNPDLAYRGAFGGGISSQYLPRTQVILPAIAATSQQTVTGNAQWSEVFFTIAQLKQNRVGGDMSRTLQGVQKVRFSFQVSASTVVQVGALTLRGSYGPDIGATGSGYYYRNRARSSVTGARTNAGPATRSPELPHRDLVTVQCSQHPDTQFDKLDIYRFGGDITAGWPYVGTVPNAAPPPVFNDLYADSDILNSPLLEFDNFQPFPDVDITRSGTCSVAGTTVTRINGDTFNTAWSAGSEINIAGVTYHLYASPTSINRLEIVENGGAQSPVLFFLQQATLLGQNLPAMWGPYYGVMMACGSSYQPGYLFTTNPNNPDSANDANQYEVTSPTEPTMNGCMYSGRSYVFTSARMFLIEPVFDTNGAAASFQLLEALPAEQGGLFARWGLCVGDYIYFRRKDGICRTDGAGVVNITARDLNLLFGHDGQPGVPVVLGTATFYPPDDTLLNRQRLSFEDGHVIFDYVSTNGDNRTIVYNTLLDVWGVDNYVDPIAMHYTSEGRGVHATLAGTTTGRLIQLSGTTDEGSAYQWEVRMPYRGDDANAFLHIRDCFLGLLSNGAATLTINTDGTDNIITLASTGGNYAKVYTPTLPLKAKAWEFAISTQGYATLFARDCAFRMKTWNGQEYTPLNPFADIRRSTT